MRNTELFLWNVLLMGMVVAGCEKSVNGADDTADEADTETGSDSDADADSDTDGDTDTDTGTATDSDTRSDGHTDTGNGTSDDVNTELSTDATDESKTDSEVSTDTDSHSEIETDIVSDSDTNNEVNSESASDTGSESDSISDSVSTEVCDGLDNDNDGRIDNVDFDRDGICDCLQIGILGGPANIPASDFEAWLRVNGTGVTRVLLQNNPGVVTPELLDQFHVLIIDGIRRELSSDEAAAIESFVKDKGRGMITLIGYGFEGSDPSYEVARANSALQPFGLAYDDVTVWGEVEGVMPTFDQQHEISTGITEINYNGGVNPLDVDSDGTTEVFAAVPSGNAGLAHQTAGDGGGRIIVWGDEWITSDSDWTGYAHVQLFWARMLAWVQPTDFCRVPIILV